MAITINGDSGISGVNGSAATPALQGTDSNTGISFGTDEVNINTGGTTRVKVDSSGRVGIGATSVSAKLHSSSGSSNVTPNASADELFLENNGNVGLQLGCPNTGNARISFGDPEDNEAGRIFYDHSTNAMQFDTAGSERVRILAGGGLTFNGDTAAANALNDYEEGTWTPALSGTSGGSYTAGGSNYGWYRKVGKLVTVGGTLHWTAQVTPYSGLLVVNGLPFVNGANRAGGTISGGNGLTFSSGYSSWAANYDIGANGFYILQVSSTNNSYSHYPAVGTSGIIYGFLLTYGTA